MSRALAYLLGTTAHVRPRRTKQWLAQLGSVDDQVTRAMTEWGLDRLGSTDRVEQAHEVAFRSLDLD